MADNEEHSVLVAVILVIELDLLLQMLTDLSLAPPGLGLKRQLSEALEFLQLTVFLQ